MTAQISESLDYEGGTYAMCTEPLGVFFSMGGSKPSFMANNTALWRGYIGQWEVLDDRLYLTDEQHTCCSDFRRKGRRIAEGEKDA